MAQTVGTASLADLIERGALEAGEPLVLRRRSKPPVTATLQADGSLWLEGRAYGTPSPAARAALGARAADGWRRWRVPRLGGVTLEEVRDADE